MSHVVWQRPGSSRTAVEDDDLMVIGDDDEEEQQHHEEIDLTNTPDASNESTAGATSAPASTSATANTTSSSSSASSSTRKRRRADESKSPLQSADIVAPPRSAAVDVSSMAPLVFDEEDDDEDVEILGASVSPANTAPSSASSQPPPRKRARVPPVRADLMANAMAAYGVGTHSPTAPPMSPVGGGGGSGRASPLAPPLSPIEMSDAERNRRMDEEEELALNRARHRSRKELKEHATLSSTAANRSIHSAAAAAAAASSASSTDGIRRRKPTSQAAASASSFASASLMHSYTGYTAHTSLVDPSLLWHQENQVVLPANAADRTEIERTFLQQVLIWDPHAPTAFRNGAKSTNTSESKELASFAKFLDPKTPLPVHFTSPLAYLGYFAPIVLENFRAQLLQTVEEYSNTPTRPPPPPAPVATSAYSTSTTVVKPPAPAAPSTPCFADRYRSAWNVLSVNSSSTVAGGGDDWFEVRLKLIQSHSSIGSLSGADIVVLGIDTPNTSATAAASTTTSLTATTIATTATPTTNVSSKVHVPSPTGSTTYVYAFLDRVDGDGATCFCRLRIYLPGVSSALSGYVASSASATKANRFQLFFNRLQQAAQANLSLMDEAPKNLFPPPPGVVVPKPQSVPVTQPVYLTRIETIITTIREYSALVKIACLLPLRIQSELLRPSQADIDDEDEDQVPPKSVIDVMDPADDMPALERPKPRKDALEHLDSPKWIGLPSSFRDHLQTTLNMQQLTAVQIALRRCETPGFTLLQGPPGTGKSKTIIALLNALHLGAFQQHFSSLIAHSMENKPIVPRPRILVCAPSNTAIDELIMRVVENFEYPPSTTTDSKGVVMDHPPELRLRGVGGFLDGSRSRYRPDIVRVGNSDAIKQELKSSVSLDARVDEYNRMTEQQLHARLATGRQFLANQESHINAASIVCKKSARMFHDMQATMDKLAALGHDTRAQPQSQQLEKLRADWMQRQSEVAHFSEKRQQALTDIERTEMSLRYKAIVKQQGRAKDREAALDALRISYLNGAQIVFCTLSGAGLDLLSRLDQPFSALIIDEAAQSTEISTLIPLIHDVQHCVLVGDPRQLPATVFSVDLAARRMWERSLFERLEQAGHQMHSLTIQYRMHGDIREFPSDYYYGGQLRDADFIKSGKGQYVQPYHPMADFKPILFYDLQSAAARGGNNNSNSPADDANSRSLGNAKEATFVVDLLAALLKQYPHVNPKQIGIITFYGKQKQLLQEELRKRAAIDPLPTTANNKHTPTAAASATNVTPPPSPFLSIEVSTVDGFQGREKQIIVVSCVRGGASAGLGFVDDVRRMNVALTRAKYALWVVGDSRALRQSSHWSAFLESVTKRKRYMSVTGDEFHAYRPKPPQQHMNGRPQQHQQHQHHQQQNNRIQQKNGGGRWQSSGQHPQQQRQGLLPPPPAAVPPGFTVIDMSTTPSPSPPPTLPQQHISPRNAAPASTAMQLPALPSLPQPGFSSIVLPPTQPQPHASPPRR